MYADADGKFDRCEQFVAVRVRPPKWTELPMEKRIVATLKTSDGREWKVSLSVGDLKTLKKECGVDSKDLFNPDGKALMKLLGEPEAVAKTLWQLVKRQAERENVSQEDFDYLLDGETLREAMVIICQAAFELKAPDKAVEAAAKLREVIAAAGEKASEAIDKALADAAA